MNWLQQIIQNILNGETITLKKENFIAEVCYQNGHFNIKVKKFRYWVIRELTYKTMEGVGYYLTNNGYKN